VRAAARQPARERRSSTAATARSRSEACAPRRGRGPRGRRSRPGVPPGSEERIFEKFYRATRAAAPGASASGWRSAARSPRPTAARSRPPTARRRRRVSCDLPGRRDAAAAASGARGGGETAMTGPGGPLILLVEDEPQLRRFLRPMLRAAGYRVIEAETAAEGVMQASTHCPDLILLDLGLPDGDGIEVTRKLRAWTPRADHRDLGPRSGGRQGRGPRRRRRRLFDQAVRGERSCWRACASRCATPPACPPSPASPCCASATSASTSPARGSPRRRAGPPDARTSTSCSPPSPAPPARWSPTASSSRRVGAGPHQPEPLPARLHGPAAAEARGRPGAPALADHRGRRVGYRPARRSALMLVRRLGDVGDGEVMVLVGMEGEGSGRATLRACMRASRCVSIPGRSGVLGWGGRR
jgi:hypothetical protein